MAAAPCRRWIAHLDMDAFYASVEQRDDPALRGLPVAVGGRQRGVVMAASYEARKFGVRSAMPSVTAKRMCPDLMFVKPRFDVYKEVSRQIRTIFLEYTPLVEPLSLDEAYLDLTGTERLLGSPLAAAHALHNAVREATQLNCSIGAASSRMVAKIASDQAKPHGILWIPPGREARFLASLDVRKMPGVGKVTERNLHECGIRKIGDLARLDPAARCLQVFLSRDAARHRARAAGLQGVGRAGREGAREQDSRGHH